MNDERSRRTHRDKTLRFRNCVYLQGCLNFWHVSSRLPGLRWSSPSGCFELSSWSCSDSSGRRCWPVWQEISDRTRWSSESSFLPLTDPPLAYASPPPASARIGSLQTQNLITRKSRLFYCSLMSVSLTVMGHPEHQALLETTELTFIPILSFGSYSCARIFSYSSFIRMVLRKNPCEK